MRISAIFATTLVASLAIACAGDNPAEPNDEEASRSPVGTFTMTTVNGKKVPMLWDEMALAGGGMLRAYWNGGSIQIRSDSSYVAIFRHTLTGPGLPGNVQQDRYEGTWRLMPGARLELRPKNGGIQYWQTNDRVSSITRSVEVPSIDGGDEEVVFVFVRG